MATADDVIYHITQAYDEMMAPGNVEPVCAMGIALRSAGINLDVAPATVIGEIAAERRRQIEAAGYDVDHDDGHPGELARAGACYANEAACELHGDGRSSGVPRLWPWEPEAYKQKQPRRALVVAAALIVAEIERIDRASQETV